MVRSCIADCTYPGHEREGVTAGDRGDTGEVIPTRAELQRLHGLVRRGDGVTRRNGTGVIPALHARRPCAAVGSPPSHKVSKRLGSNSGPARAETLRGSWKPPCRRPGLGACAWPLSLAVGNERVGLTPLLGTHGAVPCCSATRAPRGPRAPRPNGQSWPRPIARSLTTVFQRSIDTQGNAYDTTTS